MKLELTTVVDRTSACPEDRGAANLVAASRMRLTHHIETDLVEAAVASARRVGASPTNLNALKNASLYRVKI